MVKAFVERRLNTDSVNDRAFDCDVQEAMNVAVRSGALESSSVFYPRPSRLE